MGSLHEKVNKILNMKISTLHIMTHTFKQKYELKLMCFVINSPWHQLLLGELTEVSITVVLLRSHHN